MKGQVIQIASVMTPAGVALYALTNRGKIYERLVGQQFAKWVEIKDNVSITF